MIPLGYCFPVFGMLVMLGASNAVNLTDGLDGLAIVPTIICAGVFALIAYLVGNRIFADYLQLNPCPVSASWPCSARRWSGPAGLPLVQRPAGRGVHGRYRLAPHRRSAGCGGGGDQARDRAGIVGGLFVVETVSVIIQVVLVQAHRHGASS